MQPRTTTSTVPASHSTVCSRSWRPGTSTTGTAWNRAEALGAEHEAARSGQEPGERRVPPVEVEPAAGRQRHLDPLDGILAVRPHDPQRELGLAGLGGLEHDSDVDQLVAPFRRTSRAPRNELRGIASRAEQGGKREQVHRLGSAHDRDPGQRGQRRCRRLERPDSPVARRVCSGQQRALARDRVETWR